MCPPTRQKTSVSRGFSKSVTANEHSLCQLPVPSPHAQALDLSDIAGLCLYLLQINCSLKTISAPTLLTLWIPLMCSWFLPDF